MNVFFAKTMQGTLLGKVADKDRSSFRSQDPNVNFRMLIGGAHAALI